MLPPRIMFQNLCVLLVDRHRIEVAVSEAIGVQTGLRRNFGEGQRLAAMMRAWSRLSLLRPCIWHLTHFGGLICPWAWALD